MAQAGSKNIDNASGQVVRLDIENTLKTVATHNFGPRNNAGTIEPCEFLADDTTNKLLIRKSSGGDQAKPTLANGNPNPNAATFFEVGDLDTANLGLLPKSGGTLTGVLELPSGAKNVPSLHFGDTSTGFYRTGSNTIGVTADGDKKVVFKNGGTEFFGNDTSGGIIRLRESNNNNATQYVQLKAPSSLSSNVNLVLPNSTGTSGEALLTNGSGTLSFGSPSVGAANLTGNTLASGVTASSLTSVGTLSGLTVQDASGSDPSMQINHSDADVTGEFLRIGRTDLGTRYHSLKAKHGGAATANLLSFHLHDGSGSPFTAQQEVLKLEGNKQVTVAGNLDVGNGIDCTGTCTATAFSGNGSNLTGINATKIVFFGIQDTDQSIPSNSTTFTKLTNFSTNAVSLNTGSSWNTTTGRFTVASGQAGTYKIIGVGKITGQLRQTTVRVGISKNGADPTFYMEEITRHNNSPSARWETQTAPVIQIMTLAVGDYVELMIFNGDGSAQDTAKEGTYFSGYRISE